MLLETQLLPVPQRNMFIAYGIQDGPKSSLQTDHVQGKHFIVRVKCIGEFRHFRLNRGRPRKGVLMGYR